jgi:hypothetical protein
MTCFNQLRVGLAAGLCCLAWGAANGWSATPAPAPKTAAKTPAKKGLDLQEIPKSTFTYDLAARGKDPFNPGVSKVPEPAAAAPANLASAPAGSAGLSLKGIILGANRRRLAVINNQVFGVGDANEVIAPGGRVAVRCVEIGEGFAVVSVGGGSDRQILRMRKD